MMPDHFSPLEIEGYRIDDNSISIDKNNNNLPNSPLPSPYYIYNRGIYFRDIEKAGYDEKFNRNRRGIISELKNQKHYIDHLENRIKELEKQIGQKQDKAKKPQGRRVLKLG